MLVNNTVYMPLYQPYLNKIYTSEVKVVSEKEIKKLPPKLSFIP